MALIVPWAFSQFFDNINLTGDHHDIARARRDRIVSILGKEFDIMESMTIGSIPKYTAIRGEADLDVMVALHYGKHISGKNPSQVLASIRKPLAEYRTDLRRNGQAVTLYYNSWPNVDIVPVARYETNGVLNYYSVPDSISEQWIASRPDTHAQALTDRNKTSGAEFKKIIKMIKWWNKQHGNYLESYHIEVMALRSLNYAFNDFSWGILQYFDAAASLAAAPLWYECRAVRFCTWAAREGG